MSRFQCLMLGAAVALAVVGLVVRELVLADQLDQLADEVDRLDVQDGLRSRELHMLRDQLAEKRPCGGCA